MKAYNLHSVGNIKYEDVDFPECKYGWCIVQVKACGICSSDIPRIFKKGTYHFPTIPGHEFSGVVIKVAEEKYNYLIGKSVGVFPLIPCKECFFCKMKKYEMCNNYDYLGSRRDGGFSEYVAVPVWNIIECNNISFLLLAMMEPLAVSLHAVKKMDITGDVAIVGTGMMAFSAAQWMVTRGASSVTIIGRNEEKRGLANSIKGVNYLINPNISNQFDSVLEAVGSNVSIDYSLNIVKPGGTVVFMGNPDGDIKLSQDTYWRILRKQLTIKGTWNSSFKNEYDDDWKDVRDYLMRREVDFSNLISHIYPQNRIDDAFEMMRKHKELYCKVMTIWNED